MNNEELLEKIGEYIKPLVNGIAHLKTVVEALKAGQDDIREKMATKGDVKRLEQKIDKKIQDHEERLERLELPRKN